jgi:hypothetical protein
MVSQFNCNCFSLIHIPRYFDLHNIIELVIKLFQNMFANNDKTYTYLFEPSLHTFQRLHTVFQVKIILSIPVFCELKLLTTKIFECMIKKRRKATIDNCQFVLIFCLKLIYSEKAIKNFQKDDITIFLLCNYALITL